MFKAFNKPALTRRQRFTKAVVFGGLFTLLVTILNIILIKVLHLHFDILYLAIGFGIGYVIQYFGKGVQIQFSILAAVLTAVCILICDLVAFDFNIPYYLSIFTSGYDTLFALGYRIAGVYFAYRNARVV
ncbi:MAG: hypothetical protein ACOX1F_06415 [Erysipelotrichaceae bacterium]|jgi:hypothetical protein